MFGLGYFSERRLQPEIMDQPGLEARLHQQALAGLARINFWSGSCRILWQPIRELARESPGRPLRILDLATGAGDVPVALWRRARAEGVPLEIEACDRSAVAVDFARRRAQATNAAVRFFVADALAGPIPTSFDVITCSLFLHHLDRSQALQLLSSMTASAARMVLINDLRRSRMGHLLAVAGTRVLSRSPVVHYDGPKSVEGAYTMDEVRGLARDAGLSNFTVAPRFPFRFLFTWRRA